MSSICTTTLCKDGRAAVEKMRFTRDYLTSNYPNFNADSFQPTIKALQAELESVDYWYADLIPFNPTCCVIDDIGKEADILTNQMLASVGAVNVPTPPESNWSNAVLIGGIALLLVVYSPQIKSVISSRNR